MLVTIEPIHLIEVNGEVRHELHSAYEQYIMGGRELYFSFVTHSREHLSMQCAAERIWAKVAERITTKI